MSKSKKSNINAETGAIQAPTTNKGQFVLDGQVLAKGDGFSRVNKSWFDKCKRYDEVKQIIKKYEGDTEDINGRYNIDMIPCADDNGKFAFERKDNSNLYTPTPHALGLLAIRSNSFYATAQDILRPKTDPDNDQAYEYQCEKFDTETYVRHLTRKMNLIDHPEDPFLWRLNNSTGEVRAVFTSHERTKKRGAAFSAIDNGWLIDILESIVPDGRISHWRGNPDTIRTNILVPDCAMENNGADYGGGIYVTNSEIGELKLCIKPFLFVAICFNGNIWDRVDGENVVKSHRGKIDYASLEEQIRKSVIAQLQLVPQGLDTLLRTREIKWDGVSLSPIFYTVADKFKLTYQQAQKAMEAYDIEINANVENKNTLYGLVNSVTRAAQGWGGENAWKGFSGSAWENMSRAANRLIEFVDKPKHFESLIDMAKEATPKDVDKFFRVGVN